jgi:galacturan 1,4-alpha-galacturonidase
MLLRLVSISIPQETIHIQQLTGLEASIMIRLFVSWVALSAFANSQSVSHSSHNGRSTCTVHPGKTNTTDDVPTILKAFKDCGNGGDVVFPAGNTYHINSRLNPVVNDVTIDWQGEWLVGSVD